MQSLKQPNTEYQCTITVVIFYFYFISDVSCEFGSAKYYALCGFGGILSCGITHTAVVPLDLVKCRIQVNIFMMKVVNHLLTKLKF